MSDLDCDGSPGFSIDWSTKGFLQLGEPITADEFVKAGHSVFDGTFSWPLMVAKRSALEHNIATVARYASEHGLALAPHGKTTMSPALFQAQLDAGAWGITVATASQALVCRRLGVPRVLLANEIVDAAALRWLAGELERFEFLCYVDSLAGVRILDEAAGATPFRVLVELGHDGGRTGCRGVAAALEVAQAVREADGVELAGVAGYEGTLSDVDQVRGFLRELRATAEAIAPYVQGQMVVSAGGSAWFDVVADELAPLGRPRDESGLDALVIVRSGAYIAHDDGFYRSQTPYARTLEAAAGQGLRPALEVWAPVLSAPEPGLVIVGMGKRDVPHDLDLPVARAVRREGAERITQIDDVRVVKAWDQHAQLTGEGLAAAGLRPGDLVAFGISHPCTAFDKWRVIPVVDDDYAVVDVINTYF